MALCSSGRCVVLLFRLGGDMIMLLQVQPAGCFSASRCVPGLFLRRSPPSGDSRPETSREPGRDSFRYLQPIYLLPGTEAIVLAASLGRANVQLHALTPSPFSRRS